MPQEWAPWGALYPEDVKLLYSYLEEIDENMNELEVKVDEKIKENYRNARDKTYTLLAQLRKQATAPETISEIISALDGLKIALSDVVAAYRNQRLELVF